MQDFDTGEKMKKLLIMATLALAACATSTPIVNPSPIPVPAGASSAKIETAIKNGIRNARGDWVLESSKPGLVIAGLKNRTHYLQVSYEYNLSEVRSRITGSQNLNQANGSIHRYALSWQQNLDANVSKEVSLIK